MNRWIFIKVKHEMQLIIRFNNKKKLQIKNNDHIYRDGEYN